MNFIGCSMSYSCTFPLVSHSYNYSIVKVYQSLPLIIDTNIEYF